MEYEKMDELEKQQFNDFKRKMNQQAAEAQVKKLEYNLTDASQDRAFLRRACQDANILKLGAVCVLPALVKPCVAFLGPDPKVSLIACISYPHGGDSVKTKVAAVKNAIKDGVDEVEVTAPVAYIKDANWSYVKREFKKLKSAAKKRAIRINIESALLTTQEIAKVCAIAIDCGIPSLRTGSGFYGAGFNADVVAHVGEAVKDKCTIKADGIATVNDMSVAVSLGATIIGSRNAADVARIILQTAD